jgi:DNA invertase Pin-like site-specific DNA recombinase
VTKAFAYLRVSGLGQVDGDGFERQLAACTKYAAATGIEIIEVFREEGVSGTKELDDRPALAELLAALEENGIKTVIIEKLDRLARDLMVQETIVADIQKHGYTLISTCEPDLCSQDPSRVLMRQIFGAIAQYDRAITVLKLRGARQRKKARTGKGEGRHAYGEKPGEAQNLSRILTQKAAGATAKQIAAVLNLEAVPTRMGRPWNAGTVAKILTRHPADTQTAL